MSNLLVMVKVKWKYKFEDFACLTDQYIKSRIEELGEQGWEFGGYLPDQITAIFKKSYAA